MNSENKETNQQTQKPAKPIKIKRKRGGENKENMQNHEKIIIDEDEALDTQQNAKRQATNTNALTFESIASLIQNSNRNLIDSIGSRIANEMNGLQSNLESKIKTVEDKTKQRIDQLEEMILRNNRSAELIIRGIEFVENEDLRDIFTKIAEAVQYKIDSTMMMPSIKRIYDLGSKKRTSNALAMPSNASSSGMLTVTFKSSELKKIFYSCYLKKLPLKLRQIGLLQQGQIFINENLTKTASDIFHAARKLKREKQIEKCYTFNGIVFVKKSEADAAVKINRKEELTQFITK